MLHNRESFGVRMSSARKLGLERLEDRSMPSVVTAALLSSTSPAADNASAPAAQADTSTAAAAAQGTASDSAVQLLTTASAEKASGATTTNASKNVAITVDLVLLMEEENQSPVIVQFGATQGDDSYWEFYGTVTDPDDDLTSLTVTFGGVLDGYSITANCESNGTFSVTCQCVGLQWGYATAQAHDPHGAGSNVADVFILPA